MKVHAIRRDAGRVGVEVLTRHAAHTLICEDRAGNQRVRRQLEPRGRQLGARVVPSIQPTGIHRASAIVIGLE